MDETSAREPAHPIPPASTAGGGTEGGAHSPQMSPQRDEMAHTDDWHLRLAVVRAIVFDALLLIVWIGVLSGVRFLDMHVLGSVVSRDRLFRTVLDVFQVGLAVVTVIPVLLYVVADVTELWQRVRKRILSLREVEATMSQSVVSSETKTAREGSALGFAILGGLAGLSLGLAYGEITAPIGAVIGVMAGAGIWLLRQRRETSRWHAPQR